MIENGFWSLYIKRLKVFNRELFYDWNHVVTKRHFNHHKVMVTKTTPFLVACKATLGTQDGISPSLTFGWPKLTLYWCNTRLHLHMDASITSWQMHGHGDKLDSNNNVTNIKLCCLQYIYFKNSFLSKSFIPWNNIFILYSL